MARNWAEMGLAWDVENVEHKGRTIAGAQIPNITDLVKFGDALERDGGTLLGIINASNGVRVRAQAVKRANPDTGGESLKELVWRALCGMRTASGSRTVTVIKLALPNGTNYEGTSRVEFVAAYMAAGVDVGMSADIARTVAENIANANAQLV